jgi:hypothetical protein
VLAAATAIRELAQVYTPGVLIPQEFELDGSPTTIRREVQGDHLPSQRRLDELALSPLARSLISESPHSSDEDESEAAQDNLERFAY